VTYAVFLENLILEMRPKVKETFENAIITQIKDAKIEVTEKAQSERKLRVMKSLKSPSEVATLVLKEQEEKDAAEKAEKEAKEKAAAEKASEASSPAK
jgi:hypothetical protein